MYNNMIWLLKRILFQIILILMSKIPVSNKPKPIRATKISFWLIKKFTPSIVNSSTEIKLDRHKRTQDNQAKISNLMPDLTVLGICQLTRN